MGGQNATDLAVARLATAQHGPVSRAQVLALGLTPRQIERRLGAGRWSTWHDGVYLVGHRHLDREGRWTAALLAVGPAAALSLDPALVALGLRRGSGTGVVHVTVPGTGRTASPPGVRVHRSRTLIEADVVEIDGMRVTSAARTLEDVARTTRERELRRLIDEAEGRRLLHRGLDVHRRPRLRAAVAAGPPLTRFELEERFLALLTRRGLPRPRVNERLGAIRPDFRWPAEGLVVEVDGWETHRGRNAFREDRRRDRELTLLGWRVVRFTYDDVVHDGSRTAATVERLLGQRPARSVAA